MKYITFLPPGSPQSHIGAITADNQVVDLTAKGLPANLLSLLHLGRNAWVEAESTFKESSADYALSQVTLQAPLLRPNTLRDFYAFEEHVATANKNRGREVPEQWYQTPVFYFSNPHAVYGPGEEVPMPKYTRELDYELEAAAVIGTAGRDIRAEEAMNYIFGFTIFNDWSARDVQRQEMKVGLGPAKGKDFASSFGPYIITPDELENRTTSKPGIYDLEMTACINGKEYSRGNWKTLYYSFGEMIERASADVMLEPGDVIGSGTVGTGCLLELTKAKGPWLEKGDVVELEIERLGILRNKVS